MTTHKKRTGNTDLPGAGFSRRDFIKTLGLVGAGATVAPALKLIAPSPVAAAEVVTVPQPARATGRELLNLRRLAASGKKKITQADREKAAQNFQAQGGHAATSLVRGTGDAGAAAGATLIPDYFGCANWAYSPPLTKFLDKLPQLGPAGSNLLGQYIPVATPDQTTYTGADYYEIALVEYEEQLHSELPPTRHRGYVQLATGVVPGAHVPLLQVDGVTPITLPGGAPAFGVDRPHFMGPAIVATGALPGQPGRPVRVKFYNLLPTGAGGDLFIPVDTTVMGAGMGPLGMAAMPMNYTQNRATVHLHGNNTVWISDGTPHQWITPAGEMTPYPRGVSVQNVPDMPAPPDGAMTFFYSNAMSARLMFYHDHAYGITRLNVYVGEAAPYILTDQVEQDLLNGTNNSGVNPGLLRVLPGLGIPLVIQDRTFVDPATIGTTDPTWLDPNQPTFGKTPGTANLGDLWYPHVYLPAQNPWDLSGANAFGRWMYGPWFYPPTANLEFGPIPNPYCLPTPPPAGSYPNGAYDNSLAPWEPPYIPATPNPSMPGEAFMDTALVNGTVFPYLEVEPKAYRFRILNACNDRSLNLSLYKATGIVGGITLTGAGSGYTADPVVTIAPGAGDTTGHGAQAVATADLNPASPTFGQIVSLALTVVGSGYTANPTVTIAPPGGAGTAATATATFFTSLTPGGFPSEVGMVPVSGTDWLPPFDVSGVPDPANAGPDWWQIGTEGGFLPAPAVIPPHPITWNTNPTAFNFGNVNGHALCLGTAERADVIVDFSTFAGQTLILYNDAPAAFPAPDPRYDFYTNDQDQTATGGAPTTPPGKGPNTRTIMQIRVGTTVTAPATAVTLANLQAVWAKTAAKRGVFEVSQDPIIVPQAAYNSAYNAALPTAVAEQYAQVNQYTKTFRPIDASGVLQAPLTMPIQPKAVHDEMGGVYDTHYGRMSGMLGLELPATTSRLAQFLAYGYASPPVDLFKGSLAGTLVGSLDDGTQLWNISQNGVDTHTIHVHLFNAQLINRVGWDGQLLPPDPNELGWKETFRVNPLEQIFLALRPTYPTQAQIPFLAQVPNSVRLIDPTMPPGTPLDPPPPAGWFDPNGVALASITNQEVNFGWEYVYHCHILAHEEMDMMHATCFAVPPSAPTNVTGAQTGSAVTINWTNGAPNATGFTLQRANDAAFTQGLVSFPVGLVTSYVDNTVNPANNYFYRVIATNTLGSTVPGFPQLTVSSAPSNTAVMGTGLLRIQTVPAVPTRIYLNGIPRDNWGLNYMTTPAGSYTLAFTDVLYHNKPTSVTVTVGNGAPVTQPLTTPIVVNAGTTTQVVANFIPLGNLHVTTSPPVPSTIYVDGNPMNDWGMWMDIEAGPHIVSFGDVDGFTTPAPQTVTVTAGQTTTVTGNFVAAAVTYPPVPHGFLRVQTSPAVPTRIFVNGIPRDNWGLNWAKLPPGSYTLSFTNVRGFNNPPTLTVTNGAAAPVTQPATTPVTIADGVITTVVAGFVPLGNLRVETSPAVPSTVYVNGNPMDEWGMWADIEPGAYTVSFRPLSGFATPPPLAVTVAAGLTTHVVGNFTTGQSQLVP